MARENTQLPWYETGMGHIWLPYAQMQTAPEPLPVVSAEGCVLTLADGRKLIDGVASWWSVCHGYLHPHIIASVERQLRTLPHVMFGGLVHEPALALAKRLCALTFPSMQRVFFSDSGSTAVEVAMKMALQYWRNKGQHNKDRFICFHDGYHGDTLGAMGVSDPERGMHKAFRTNVIKHFVLSIPQDEYSLAEFSEMVKGIASNTAALMIEPLVQGAGGMKFHSPDMLAEIRRLCAEHSILFIADEIATGFGRTGTMFACQEAGIEPDILCLGKALTGGTMGLAATLASAEIFNAFLSDEADKAFMHGPTYMANPLACAAANASLDLFEREPRLKQVEVIESRLRQGMEACRALPGVTDVRVKGAIGVVQLEPAKMDALELRRRFIANGVWIRPFGDIVYLTPPFTVHEAELATLLRAVYEVLKKFLGESRSP